jgi:hypothetical protein
VGEGKIGCNTQQWGRGGDVRHHPPPPLLCVACNTKQWGREGDVEHLPLHPISKKIIFFNYFYLCVLNLVFKWFFFFQKKNLLFLIQVLNFLIKKLCFAFIFQQKNVFFFFISKRKMIIFFLKKEFV